MSSFDRGSWPVHDREAFRAVARKWVAANWSVSITVREWWRRLAEVGFTAPTWAVTAGGIGATTAFQGIIEAELGRIVTIGPPLSGVGVHLVGPVLRQHGSADQRDRYLPSIIDGTSNWCVLFEEPDARTDLAAVVATATQTGRQWSVTAVKLSSDADLADRGLILVRTDTDSTGSAGLSCFAISLDQPTVSVQPLARGGSVVVCHGATVTADDLVGEMGDGWAVVQTVLAHRKTSLAGRIRRGVVDVMAGEKAGNLDRLTGDVITRAPKKRAPAQERRQRP